MGVGGDGGVVVEMDKPFVTLPVDLQESPKRSVPLRRAKREKLKSVYLNAKARIWP